MDASRLKIRRIISYEPETKDFSMSISFGGFVLYAAAHHTSYLAAEDYYNRLMTNMEAIFNNLNEATKLSFHSPDKDVTGTVDTRTLEVEFDIQSDEASEAEMFQEITEATLAEWEDERAKLQKEIEEDELQEIASELRGEDDVDPEETDEPYEPYERIHTDYDPIRYE